MPRALTLTTIALFATLALGSQPAHAIFHKTRLTLAGCRGFLAATGSATYTSSVGETDYPDGEKVVIEIRNVPLPAGTELLVFIHENEVGTIKLDKKRNGRLVLESKFRQLAPPLKLGSFIVLKLEDGTSVMW